MTITHNEFFYGVLFRARCMDERWPNLGAEKIIWQRWAFGNDGAHYIPKDNGKWRIENGE